jgi:hypothetical protein
VLAQPASADPVTVRIEGETAQLAATTVDPPATGVFGPNDCPWDSAGGAIQLATGGNWDGGPFVSTILGETHSYAARDWWQFWMNRSAASVGVCAQPIDPGDEILMIVQRDDPTFQPTVFPLFVTAAPASVERGAPAQVTIAEHVVDVAGTTTPRPAAGATVAGGGATAVTGADGRATLTFPQAGSVDVRATAPSRAPSNVARIAVTEPGAPAAPGAPAGASSGTAGSAGSGGDHRPPRSFVSGIEEQQVFSRRRAPRVLRGRSGEGVPFSHGRLRSDPSGLLMVKLRLTVNAGGRCGAWSPSRERFVGTRCGARHGWYFDIGDRAEWEYQLAQRLPRGRYVLDVNAIDRSYNRDDERRRGENRIVFHVR